MKALMALLTLISIRAHADQLQTNIDLKLVQATNREWLDTTTTTLYDEAGRARFLLQRYQDNSTTGTFVERTRIHYYNESGNPQTDEISTAQFNRKIRNAVESLTADPVNCAIHATLMDAQGSLKDMKVDCGSK